MMMGKRSFFIIAVISVASAARIDLLRHALSRAPEKKPFAIPSFLGWLNKTLGWTPLAQGTRCGLVARSVTHAGEVWKSNAEGLFSPSQQQAHTHCTRPGFSSIQHGDGRNQVTFLESDRFLYVPGNEVGTGAGVTICDLDDKPASLEYVFTDGLSGCMAVSIVGTRREDKQRDMFFCHARRWSDYARGEDIPATDPLHAARDFVRIHENLQIFYGTGDHKLDQDGHYNSAMEAQMLSSILGVWVQSDRYHNLPLTADLAFHVDNEAWVPLTGEEERVRMFSAEEKEKDLVSAYATPQWEPNGNLVNRLSQLRLRDKHQQGCGLSLRAYIAGDYDGLQRLIGTARHAKNSVAFSDEVLAVLEDCDRDMTERRYGHLQQSQRLQIDFDRSVGRHVILTPRSPNLIGPGGSMGNPS